MFKRWSQPNGYRRLLAISLPLVASMSSIMVMQFTDRVFLANYSVRAISAALPAGVASFAFISFFMGTANYTNAFIAQYVGADRPHRVGASVWQGIYFALLAAVFLALMYFIAQPLFDLIGHDQSVRELEVSYFRIIILGAGLVPLASAMSCFYSGRGLTWTVMVVHLAGAAINIPLDYALINGWGPFPRLGIVGAGLATVAASAIITLILVGLVFSPKNERLFQTRSNRSFDRDLFGRLLKYGVPSGVQFFLEIFGFTFFIFMLGRLGQVELAASNIVLSLESMSFMPMVGFAVGVSTLVGQAVGAGRPEDGVEATTSALHLCLTYMVSMGLLFVLAPEPLLMLFKDRGYTVQQYAPIIALGTVLLRFVAVFTIFDTLNLVFSGAIKGAGDTRFIMWTIAALSLGLMVIPIWLALEVFGGGIYAAWSICVAYIISLGLAFWLRYRNGAWKKMRVIEETGYTYQQRAPFQTAPTAAPGENLWPEADSPRLPPR